MQPPLRRGIAWQALPAKVPLASAQLVCRQAPPTSVPDSTKVRMQEPGSSAQ